MFTCKVNKEKGKDQVDFLTDLYTGIMLTIGVGFIALLWVAAILWLWEDWR
jgi:hypothetical protein